MSLATESRSSVFVYADYLGDLAVWSLEQEAKLSPKPGLVDSRGSGVHSDMTLSLLLRSARELGPWFSAMAEGAVSSTSDIQLRCDIGSLGRKAEKRMLTATGGVNTHRGAIWALGLLATAGATHTESEQDLFERAGAIARIGDLVVSGADQESNGRKACRLYGVPGAREQAQSGFPHVRELGLPTLRKSRDMGDPEPVAQLNALIAIMAELADTCVLSRSGKRGLETVQAGARRVLEAGGCGNFEGREALAALESRMIRLGASAGGAADLLAATLFVDRLLPVSQHKGESHYANLAI
ncbi:MAG: triphosphoribosyl-dephospho-CoA synthase [Marinobacter sp.]|nr:triphosphoribosyl-dephospho-CoA synthase [Marinobacter sp.]